MPQAERPDRAWGYPLAAIVFIIFAAFYFVLTLYTDINNYLSGKTNFISSVIGLFLTAAGTHFYFYFKKRYGKKVHE